MKKMSVCADVLIRKVNIAKDLLECPTCGLLCKKHSKSRRWIHAAHPRRTLVLEISGSKHFCPRCVKFFSSPTCLAPNNSNYTTMVHKLACQAIEDGCSLAETQRYMLKKHHVPLPVSTLCGWIAEGTWRPNKSAV